MHVAGLPTVAIRRPLHPSLHPAQIRRSLSLDDSVHRSSRSLLQWKEEHHSCTLCGMQRDRKGFAPLLIDSAYKNMRMTVKITFPILGA